MDEKTEPLRALREGEIILAKGTPHEVRIPCAILSDGQRLITATGTIQAFNQDERSHRAGPTQLPRFLQANSVKSALDKELPGPAQAPVLFTPLHGGRAAHGFAAGFLTKSSRAVLAARRTDPRWRKTQEPLAHAAERLLGALAETGEVALIDEACGVVPEPDAYAKTATDAGAAEAIAELRQQLAIMGHNLERAVVTAREQSEGNARGWARVGELERQLKALSAGPVSPQQLEWMKERMHDPRDGEPTHYRTADVLREMGQACGEWLACRIDGEARYCDIVRQHLKTLPTAEPAAAPGATP